MPNLDTPIPPPHPHPDLEPQGETIASAIVLAQRLMALNRRQLADRLCWLASKLSELANGKRISLDRLLHFCGVTGFPLEAALDEACRSDVMRHAGVSWRSAGRSQGVVSCALRTAASSVLSGQSCDRTADAVADVYRAFGAVAPRIDEATVLRLVQGAITEGAVELRVSPDGGEIEDRDLAGELEAALAAANPAAAPTRVCVVRSLAHPSFRHDPLAPVFAALVAHRLVAEKVRRLASVLIGVAGGAHLGLFARLTSATSAPFQLGATQPDLVFLPLMQDVFRDARVVAASGVVSELVARSRALLMSEKVDGRRLHPLFYDAGSDLQPSDRLAELMAREDYRQMQIAVFGIGDVLPDGSLAETLEHLGLAGAEPPAADICLRRLDAASKPIPLPAGCPFVGVALDDIRRLVRQPGGMALAIATGAAKGRPIAVVARAGYCDTLVCDQAAARAAIAAL